MSDINIDESLGDWYLTKGEGILLRKTDRGIEVIKEELTDEFTLAPNRAETLLITEVDLVEALKKAIK